MLRRFQFGNSVFFFFFLFCSAFVLCHHFAMCLAIVFRIVVDIYLLKITKIAIASKFEDKMVPKKKYQRELFGPGFFFQTNYCFKLCTSTTLCAELHCIAVETWFGMFFCVVNSEMVTNGTIIYWFTICNCSNMSTKLCLLDKQMKIYKKIGKNTKINRTKRRNIKSCDMIYSHKKFHWVQSVWKCLCFFFFHQWAPFLAMRN